MSHPWRDGNRLRLLENGEDFYPRVHELLRAARHSIYVETFILRNDEVGLQLCEALVAAAGRGVQVDVLADGFGSDDLPPQLQQRLRDAGVRLNFYEPRRRILGVRTNLFRRMHRKIVLVDDRIALLGGINFCTDHLSSSGPSALHDYAVEVEGPVVDDVRDFAERSRSSARRGLSWWFRRRALPHPHPATTRRGPARARFVTRDNHRHRDDIEHEYRLAIRLAQQRIVIANAYFFPGYRLLRDLRRAAQRGVDVCIIVQGNPDLKIVTRVARWLYHYLVPAGVRIFEFCKRPMHAKVALVDQRWATVGSSNLDPLSLALNLEANLVIDDAAFCRVLDQRLQLLLDHDCRQVSADRMPPRTWWRTLGSTLMFHFLRHFPAWAHAIPARPPRIEAASASHDHAVP